MSCTILSVLCRNKKEEVSILERTGVIEDSLTIMTTRMMIMISIPIAILRSRVCFHENAIASSCHSVGAVTLLRFRNCRAKAHHQATTNAVQKSPGIWVLTENPRCNREYFLGLQSMGVSASRTRTLESMLLVSVTVNIVLYSVHICKILRTRLLLRQSPPGGSDTMIMWSQRPAFGIETATKPNVPATSQDDQIRQG